MKYLQLILTGILLLGPSLFAQQNTPEGNWRTFDEKTGKPKAIIKIEINDSILTGKIIKSFEVDSTEVCSRCSGKQKNQPIYGLQIIQNMVRKKDPSNWGSGTILDPENGNVYSCTLQLKENGKKLIVRGFLGVAAFGRTQIWIRDPL
jgi:uncharacterized protein (DUF2147 family)